MCRFNAKDDDGYEKFSGVLAKFFGQIRTENNEADNQKETEKHNADKARREGQSPSGLWFDFPNNSASKGLILSNVRSFDSPRLRRAPITRVSTAEF